MKNIFLCLFLLLVSFFSSAQTGPGGVGNSTSNILWLKADALTGLNDNDPLTTWNDFSGNSKNLTQATVVYKPIYKTSQINGKPVIRFDGNDDYIIRNPFTGFATSAITEIFVNKNVESNDALISYASTGSDNDFLIFNSSAVNIYRGGNIATASAINNNNFNTCLTRWQSTGGTTRLHINGTEISPANLSPGTSITSGGSLIIGQEQDNVGGGFDVSQAHSGDFAEIIIYNYYLNNAQVIIVQNYLAAKYNIAMTANDLFAYETTHGNDVAGIGRTNAANTNLDAKSGGILEISSPSGIGDNEYLLFGHDNASVGSWTTTEIPNGDVTDARRVDREWRLSETGDVGTITVMVDTALLSARPSGFSDFVLWVDADGDFSNGAVAYPMSSAGGSLFQAISVNITNGDYISFGCIRPQIQFTLTNSSDFETTPSVNIQISLNYPLANNTSVNYTVTGGTATGGGVDYTLPAGVATITSGNTTTNITVTITNDILVESDETILVSLLDGLGIPYNTHTFTIHDEDNARKIDFTVNNSNGGESVTPVTLTLQINLLDAVNPTTVDYSVTGGTATGSGTDYTLASGTAIIPANNLTTIFNITINEDILDEANETIIITLTNPTNSNLGTNYIYTYTINDNDLSPIVQFNAVSSGASESTSPSIQVDLSAVSGQNVNVNYTVTGGTATGGGVDYTLSNGTLTINAGSTSGTINPVIINDVTEELSETIILTLSAPINAILGANTVHTYTIIDNDPFGYTGPGGVGQSNSNVLWLKSDEITGLSNGNDVTSWTDNSGNNNTMSQSNTTYTPRYYTNVINSKPVVRFEQADTRFRKTSFNNMPTTAVTSMFVNRNSDSNDGLISYATASDNNEYLIFNSGNVTLYRGGNNSSGQVINGNTWRIITATWLSSSGSWILYRNGTQSYSGTVGTGTTIASGGCLAIGGEQDAVDGGYDPAQSHNGDFTEVIIYDVILNSAQRIIVENYLSSKYNIAIVNDRYAFDVPHGNEVAGIGRVDASNFHLDAKGTGIVRINNPSSLDNNDYMLWGHDNASNATPNTADVPAGINNRMNRVWRVDKTNDVGTVTVSFDLTGITVNSGNDLELLIDADGVFTNATRYTTGRTWNSPIVTFTGVNFSDGDYFTIGSSSPSTPLPIELISFTAQPNNNKVNLNWSTNAEINNDYFTIERSNNGIEFVDIGKVYGQGNSNVLNSYFFVDNNPYHGISYYRLRQTDYNGNNTVSEKVSVNISNFESLPLNFELFPNPINKGENPTLKISSFEPEKEVLVVVVNLLGEQLFSKVVMTDYSGNSITGVDLENKLPSGTYLIIGTSLNQICNKYLIIQ